VEDVKGAVAKAVGRGLSGEGSWIGTGRALDSAKVGEADVPLMVGLKIRVSGVRFPLWP
jgi:hypothetical protein